MNLEQAISLWIGNSLDSSHLTISAHVFANQNGAAVKWRNMKSKQSKKSNANSQDAHKEQLQDAKDM